MRTGTGFPFLEKTTFWVNTIGDNDTNSTSGSFNQQNQPFKLFVITPGPVQVVGGTVSNVIDFNLTSVGPDSVSTVVNMQYVQATDAGVLIQDIQNGTAIPWVQAASFPTTVKAKGNVFVRSSVAIDPSEKNYTFMMISSSGANTKVQIVTPATVNIL